ncbi:SsgA family sporulation/cell division regulator [Streptomyces sp. NPDC092296]|uniref:SsgA family sporulation/cell division regulator n=1 Tax=Streptomyces sp. NPDC092296 TaxID=3366012 RepID=UPI003829A5FE
MPREPLPSGTAAPHGAALPPDLADRPRERPPADPEPTPPAVRHPLSGQVESLLTLHMVFDGDRVAEVPTRFRYDAAEPFAVRLAFHADEYDEAEWVFARELLADGLRGPSGEGDIRLWPSHCPEHGAVVTIALESPHGSAVLEAVTADLRQLLERSYAVVPPGSEVSALPSDEELARLTGG